MARLSECFDKKSVTNLGDEKKGATKILQFMGPRKKNYFGPLYSHNPTLEGIQLQQTEDPHIYLNMDYEMHQGTKTIYFSRVQDSDQKTAATKPM